MTEVTELHHLIYEQLMELYLWDLEIELLSEKLKNVNSGTPQIPVPYPWEKPYQPRSPWDQWDQTPHRLGPPWIVTCQTAQCDWPTQ